MAGVDLGIDLGTTKIIIYRYGKGIVLEEPSVVAYHTKTEKVVAVGHEALRMLGRTPAYIRTECPIRDGVISNHLFTEYLIKEFVKKVSKSFLIKPRIAICIPSAITDVEARAVVEAAMSAGARKVYLVDEPIAAAIGAGPVSYTHLDVYKRQGHMDNIEYLVRAAQADLLWLENSRGRLIVLNLGMDEESKRMITEMNGVELLEEKELYPLLQNALIGSN